MKPSPEITGNWRLPPYFTENDEFLHIGEDGRIVHFAYIEQSGDQVMSLKLWCENLGGNRYLICPSPGHEGWEVGIARTQSGIEIERNEEAFPIKLFRLTPAMNEELPPWFAERLDRALANMIEAE